MHEVRSSVRISISLRNQLKVLAKELSTQQFNRVTIVGLLEEGIDNLLRLPLEEWVRWAKEKRQPMSVGEESIPIRIDAERADKIGLLAATIQQQSHVPTMIVDLTEEAGRRIISQVQQAEAYTLINHNLVNKQFLYEEKEKYSMKDSTPSQPMKGSVMSEEEKNQAPHLATFVVIMVYNRKGGVGKTSVSGNLAAMLAALGFHVAIIDGDDQTNVSRLDDKKRALASLTNVIMETRLGPQTYPAVPMRDAMVQVRKRLWLIPADSTLTTANDHIGSKDEQEALVDRVLELRGTLAEPPSWQERFAWLHKPIVTISSFHLEPTTDEEYKTPPNYLDFVFFDTPPADNHLTTSMMLASDKILVPVEMDQFSADGLQKVLEGIKRRFRHRAHKAEIIGVLPNKVLHQSSDTLTMDFLESVWHHFSTLARPPIHHDLAIKSAWAYGQTALEYSRDSRGTRELCALALELVGYEGDMAGLSNCDICEAAIIRAGQPVPAEEV